jgi:Na+/proline symporter
VLAPVDWAVIGAYLALSVTVAFLVRGRAEASRRSYFIADRSLPWWWAGTSIAATTFAADTPLAITGIVASRGISGNWLWLAWMGVHAGVVVVFARRWWRTGVVTDAEFIAERYGTAPAASALRSFRAGLYGLVYNAIILGWVLRAMEKIVQPIFPWSETATLVGLVAIVTLYSAIGGIRGVIITDLVQFALGLLGSTWLAVAAWRHIGGSSGLREGLAQHYGEGWAQYTALFPDFSTGWAAALGIGAFGFGAYLLAQSYANVPADGGGYLQQRLNSTRSERDAQMAAGLFFVIQYLVRIWPWLVVALAALVIYPLGVASDAGATTAFGDLVAADREMAYPALMFSLLPAGVLGVLVVSLLAAFMSTIDTHFNWGASYVVSDVLMRVRPDASRQTQVRVARAAVVGFAVLAVLVALQIETIEQAWRWVAALGAALGVPTVLRWVWWRMNPHAEIGAAVAGLVTAGVLLATDTLPYELQLVAISAASVAGVAAGIAYGGRVDAGAAATFARTVSPIGLWPDRTRREGGRELLRAAASVALIVAVATALLWTVKTLLFG